MKKALTIVGTLVLAVAIAIPVLAHGPDWGKGKGMGMGFSERRTHHCESIPNLTPEQSAKLTELKEQRLKEVAPLRNELISKRAELRSLWTQGNPDEAAIKAKQQKINDLRNQLQDKMTGHRLEVAKILTPEQRAQLQSARPGMGYRLHAKRPGARGYGRMRNR